MADSSLTDSQILVDYSAGSPRENRLKDMDYDGYKWIPVKHFRFDPVKSWEENFRALEKHHIEETSFLIEEVRKLAAKLPKENRHVDC